MLLNMDKFNELSDGQKVMVEQAIWGAAMAFHESKGVTIHRWPDDTLNELESAWEVVIEEQIVANDDAKKIWASYCKFREEYKIWDDNGYLN